MTGHVVLCPNPYRDIELQHTSEAMRMLEADGIRTVVCPVFNRAKDKNIPQEIKTAPLEENLEGASLVISFGGDGTILHAARAAMPLEVPIIGVNLGSKGFMAELEPEELPKILEAARGNFQPDRRMMLSVTLSRRGEIVHRDHALNDAVVTGIIQVIYITAFGDGRKITEFSGDGIIVATPTGSTAYSMAAGGPLVEPSALNMILTPICAHVLAARSFVLAPEREVTLQVEKLTGKRAVLSVDGGDAVDIMDGDIVTVKRSKYTTLLAHVAGKSFYDIAYEKLGERK